MTVGDLKKLLEEYMDEDEILVNDLSDSGALFPADRIDVIEAWYTEGYPQYSYDYHKQGHDRSRNVLVISG